MDGKCITVHAQYTLRLVLQRGAERGARTPFARGAASAGM